MDVGVREGTVESIGYVVPPDQLVRDLHPDLPSFRAGEAVFATGFMAGLLEEPCMACLRQHRVRPGEATVGARVDVLHRAPSVPGDRLTVTAECVAVDDPRFGFRVSAFNHRIRAIAATATVVQQIVAVDQFRAQLTSGTAADYLAPSLLAVAD